MGNTHPNIPAPPQWSLALGSFGGYAVLFGLIVFLASALLAIFGRRNDRLLRFSTWTFILGNVSLFATFAVLGILFAMSRLEYSYVSGHSDPSYGLAYRIAGIWSGQQGSFLLWAVCSAIFGLVYLKQTEHYRPWYIVSYSVFLASLCGILAYETPFKLNLIDGHPFMPSSGVGLVPALQNYWVIIHPPTIFLGFGALAVFAMAAFSALVTGDLDSWAPKIRPLALANIGLLGLGLCMGGFWAYETLGWGGFWAWDPVENTSFVPWCLVVIFAHGLLVQTARKRWHLSTALFGGFTFLSFVYGTFLTRSGLLSDTSVHSFAQMDKTAYLFLLGFLIVGLTAFLGVWIYRAFRWSKEHPAPESPGQSSRENLIRNGMVFVLLLGGSAAIGMSVPMIQLLAKQNPKNVDEHTYHMILTWFFVPLLVLMAAAPFASWAKASWKVLLNRVLNSVILSFGLLGVLLIVFTNPTIGVHSDPHTFVSGLFKLQMKLFPWMMFLTWLCLFVAVASFWRLFESWKEARMTFGAMISHVGVAVLMAGLIISRGFEKKESTNMSEDMAGKALGYSITYADIPVANELYWSRLFDRHNEIRFNAVGDSLVKKRLTIGEEASLVGLKFKYLKPTQDGMPGQAGTKFGAELQLNGKRILNPTIELQPSGAIFHSEEVAPGKFAQLTMIDAKNKAVEVSINDGFVATPGHYMTIGSDGNPNPMVWPHVQRGLSHDVYFTLHPQVIEASEAVTFKVGETKQIGPLTATYVKPTRKGEPGQPGTEFGALMRFQTDAGSAEANPVMKLTEQGVEPDMVQAAPGFLVTMTRIDAASQSVELKLLFSKPLYQIDLYYKPMTILVWLGTGILFVGGLAAAIARRPRRIKTSEPAPSEPPGNDATV